MISVQNKMWQLHTFEDRVMKLGETHIKNRVTLNGVILMGETTVGDDVEVKPNSVCMKGEELLPGTTYAGVPLRVVV